MTTNIYARTSLAQSYPSYVSLNISDNGVVELTVRGPATPDGKCGETVTVVMPDKELSSLAQALQAYLK